MTDFFYSIPPWMLLLLVCSIFGLLGGSGTWLFRKYVHINACEQHNEVTGYIFGAIAGLYSLLLAFVVFIVWDQLNDTQANTDIEASLAKGLYTDIWFLQVDDSSETFTKEKSELLIAFTDYIKSVKNEEFVSLSQNELSAATAERFDILFEKIENMKMDTDSYHAAQMFTHLNDLTKYRNLRLLAAGSRLPAMIWIPLLLGGLLTLMCAMMLQVKSAWYHIFINTTFGTFIGLVMYLVVLIDVPFRGDMGIKPDAFQDILELHEKHLNMTNKQ